MLRHLYNITIKGWFFKIHITSHGIPEWDIIQISNWLCKVQHIDVKKSMYVSAFGKYVSEINQMHSGYQVLGQHCVSIYLFSYNITTACYMEQEWIQISNEFVQSPSAFNLMMTGPLNIRSVLCQHLVS